MGLISLFMIFGISLGNINSIDSSINESFHELIEYRTTTQKVYSLCNGLINYRFFSSPVHRLVNGKYVDIDFDNIFDSNDIEVDDSFIISPPKEDVITRYENADSISSYEEYLISSNQMYIFPDESKDILIGGKLVRENKYSLSRIDNDNIDYPLTRVVERNATTNNSINPIIKDKYITVGLSGYNDSSTLLAGKDTIQTVDENGNIIDAIYKSIIGLNVPGLNPNAVVSATLGVKKNTFTTNINRNPNIYLKKITNSVLYDDIDGKTSLTSTLIATGTPTLRQYSFDVTSDVISSLNSNGVVLFLIEGSNSGYASFYSTESNSAGVPYIDIVVNPNIEGSSPFGTAPAYRQENNENINCLGYAMDLNERVDVDFSSLYTNKKIPSYSSVYYFIEIIFTHKNFDIREINDYNSFINSDERRIAFRYNHSYFNYHFILQNNDGTWASKSGRAISIKGKIGVTPEEYTYWGAEGLGSENTHYYAIKPTQGD